MTREISVRKFVDSEEVANESYSIVICGYSTADVESRLEEVGFGDIRVTGALEDRPQSPLDERIMLEATA